MIINRLVKFLKKKMCLFSFVQIGSRVHIDRVHLLFRLGQGSRAASSYFKLILKFNLHKKKKDIKIKLIKP
jgi:hypothetical protein